MTATIFQAFRIMFGLILAGFFLYFFLSYAGVYSETEESGIRLDIIKNFKSAIEDVYKTGVSVTFSQFGESGMDFDLSFDADYNPPAHYPSLVSNVQSVRLMPPSIIVPGDEVFVYRTYFSLGWWKLYFVEALPDMAVIFASTDAGKGLVNDIVSHMPSTGQAQVDVTFGFCDEGDLYYDSLCDGGSCERTGFQDFLDSGFYSSSVACTATLPESHRVVTISGSCSSAYAGEGVCLTPPDESGIGYAYVHGSQEQHVYRNIFDVLSLVLGGDEGTMQGITGERFYRYSTNVFREHIRFAALMTANRVGMLAAELGTGPECVDDYLALGNTLESISTLLAGDYGDYSDSIELAQLLGQADAEYESLLSKGCEVREYLL